MPRRASSGRDRPSREGDRPAFPVVLRERGPRPRGALLEPFGAGAEAAAFAAARVPVPIEEVAGPRVPAAAPAVARVLVSERGAPPEARIVLNGGALAGASIHLVHGRAGVELRLAAPSEAAGAALAGAVDRARLLLRSRGIVVRAGRAVEIQTTPGRRRTDDGRAR